MPTKTTMPVDEIVAEVRAIREAYAARFGFDLRTISRDAREQQRVGGRRVVSLPPRRPVTAGRAVTETNRPDAAATDAQ